MAEELPTQATGAAGEVCAQCGRPITPDDRVEAGGRVFCRSCHASLRHELETAVGAMSEDINYLNAALGAVLGGTVGVLAWWGFTVATGWSIGLIAVGLGWAVGWSVVHFAGGKRSQGLQLLSAGVAIAGWAVATYLVNVTFMNRVLAKEGGGLQALSYVPASPELFARVVAADFGLMDLVFLAIMVWEAWKMPRPIRLQPRPGT